MKIIHIIALLVFGISACTSQERVIDLSGKWAFDLDPEDRGIVEEWYLSELKDSLTLPGSLVENDRGEEIGLYTEWTGQVVDDSWYTSKKYESYRQPGNLKIPFWLQPLKKYTGAVWYQKEIVIPDDWDKKIVLLYLERCHWETQVWIDSLRLGSMSYLATPHVYRCADLLDPGSHTLTIRVDNRIKDINPGINSHSISDHTQSNWNGIVGELSLESRPQIEILNIQIIPDSRTKSAFLNIEIDNHTGEEARCKLNISAEKPGKEEAETIRKESLMLNLSPGVSINTYELYYGPDISLWDEFTPSLYGVRVEIESKSGRQEYADNFGFRHLETIGTRISLNGRPLFLRGTLECSIFPLSGYPETGIEEWRKIYQTIKSHGLNHMRFHSWCPPDAAFTAADQEGVYLQVECSSWANSGSSIGDGEAIDNWLIEESKSIISTYGNHPSFIMMAYGNEPAGNKQKEWLGDFVSYWKEKDNRRLYTGGAGWPAIDENDYHNLPGPRIQGWGQELKSIINGSRPSSSYDWADHVSRWDKPLVSHEIGQWCVYPDFKEIDKYKGVLKAKNFEIFRETLAEAGLSDLAESFLMASGKLQALCYKAEIEAALRTPGFAGFQLLDLHDFPGQGTALVGVLNAFWEKKGYISPEEFRQFSGSLVPLCRLEKMIFSSEEVLQADVEIAHYGPEDLGKQELKWTLSNSRGEEYRSGTIDIEELPTGANTKPGLIEIPLAGLPAPEMYKLTIEVGEGSNAWDIWIYPENNPSPGKEVLLARSFSPAVKKHLDMGGSVIISPHKGDISERSGGDIGIGFSSIFWNTAWTRGQKPHTLGILCDPEHPALSDFPTQYHSNWQWWDAMSHSNAIVLSRFEAKINPIVRVIDDWFQNRDLGLIFEAKCGSGKVLVSGIDLISDSENRIEARQLLYSLSSYVESEDFDPISVLKEEELRAIFN